MIKGKDGVPPPPIIVQTRNTLSYPLRQLYRPSSTIYHDPEIGENLADKLKSSQFDLSKPSGKRKFDKPRSRSDPVKGLPRVRQLGNHKTGHYNYQKP